MAEDKFVINVVSTDCQPELLERIRTEAMTAFNKFQTTREMAEYMKKKFDETDGPTWNCIVGHNFAANVKRIFISNPRHCREVCLSLHQPNGLLVVQSTVSKPSLFSTPWPYLVCVKTLEILLFLCHLKNPLSNVSV